MKGVAGMIYTNFCDWITGSRQRQVSEYTTYMQLEKGKLKIVGRGILPI